LRSAAAIAATPEFRMLLEKTKPPPGFVVTLSASGEERLDD
jgi:hypothetical protein